AAYPAPQPWPQQPPPQQWGAYPAAEYQYLRPAPPGAGPVPGLGKWSRRLGAVYGLILVGYVLISIVWSRSTGPDWTVMGPILCAAAGIWVSAGVLTRAPWQLRLAVLPGLILHGYFMLTVLTRLAESGS
ncbi:hypothetical protein P8605_34645, partial [Streptomyces sp. T-3]|nr:hypothetical protein [Streptomyces sp. T-3]